MDHAASNAGWMCTCAANVPARPQIRSVTCRRPFGLIATATAKRAALLSAQPAAHQAAKVLAMLPKVAGEFLNQIEQGPDGDPRAALKARIILKSMMTPITLAPEPPGEGLQSDRI